MIFGRPAVISPVVYILMFVIGEHFTDIGWIISYEYVWIPAALIFSGIIAVTAVLYVVIN